MKCAFVLIFLMASMGWGQAGVITAHTGETLISTCTNLPPFTTCQTVLQSPPSYPDEGFAVQLKREQALDKQHGFPNPLKCGKYQHVVKGAGQCFDDAEGKKPNPAGFWCATESFPAHCADDMHEVTEREWQELMARVKALESKKP